MRVIEQENYKVVIGTKEEVSKQRLKELTKGRLISGLELYDGELYCFCSLKLWGRDNA